MKRIPTLVSICVLLGSSAAWADATTEGCEKFKKDLTGKFAAKCPDEKAEAEKNACKNKDDLNAIVKIFKICGDKMVKDAAAGGGATEKKCRATLPDGTTIIAEETAAKTMECSNKLKAKVTADKCTGDTVKFEYLTQSEVAGAWSKGSKATARCPKKKK